jgi:hypothetical protein
MKKQSSAKSVGILRFVCVALVAFAILFTSATVFAASSWSVFCKNDGSVVYADTTQIGWSSSGMQQWAGPYQTAPQAKRWIDVNCPSGLCTPDGKCVK